MELFPEDINPLKNLLPKDGTVQYFGKILDSETAQKYFHRLMESVDWRNDEAFIFGKRIITKRKVAWYGDQDFAYTYSHSTKRALPWTAELLELRQIVEKASGETFNSCLLNLYHDGNEGMAYHSDDEKDLKNNAAIASLSLGAERRFLFKHKATGEKITLFLEDGSLLIMKDETQKHWMHRLPPTRKVFTPRINLTFRTIQSK